MVSLQDIDLLIVVGFFVLLFAIGYFTKLKSNSNEDYLTGSRKMRLPLFVATTVATWYGGILGIGEFTYSYGIVSWVTQGIPYYFFALVFAFFFAKKIRGTSLLTIPEKLEKEYGRKVAVISAVIIFILVNPAPYLLMIGSLFGYVFHISTFLGMLIAILIVTVFLIKGGFRTTLTTDFFQFILMFVSFGIIVFFLFYDYGQLEFLKENLPSSHLSLKGISPFYLFVWFLIALWTFVDPGFHQRSYNAKSGNVAKWGIVISVVFWFAFDFLTTSTGLFSRAILGTNINPILSFPLLAEKVLPIGLRGIFFAGLFATILSTFNSLTFLSGLTFAKDFLKKGNESKIIFRTRIGILVSIIVAILIALYFQSIIQIWYTIGSILIPGLIFPVVGAYYSKLKISNKLTAIEMIASTIISLFWFLIKDNLGLNPFAYELLEPMIVGLGVAIFIHVFGILKGNI